MLLCAIRDMRAALRSAVGGSAGVADGILLDLGVSSMQASAAGGTPSSQTVNGPHCRSVEHACGQPAEYNIECQRPSLNSSQTDTFNSMSVLKLDQPARGFSFMRDGPLDMRMGGLGAKLSAEALVNTADEAELGRILRDWGEERGWRRIAARWELDTSMRCFTASFHGIRLAFPGVLLHRCVILLATGRASSGAGS